jgi:hypothetical protein
MGASCNCLSFIFIGIKCQSDYYDFYLSGSENGRPYYLGTIMSIEYKIYWDGTKWIFQQTNLSFPEIPFFSTVDTPNICDLIGSDWQIGDTSTFPETCLVLNGIDISLSQCPEITEECYCYEFTPTCDFIYEYLDCNLKFTTIKVFKNETYKICSRTVPTSNCRVPYFILNNGECFDNKCPEPLTTTTTTFFPITTTTTTFFPIPDIPLEPTNECDVITIFPMGVECSTLNPSFDDTFDGVASLIITGGTPPYEILWNNGSVGPTVSNLGVGEYKATVKDFYGDFTIQTNCVLTAETHSVTTTTSTTIQPEPSFIDLCMAVTSNNSNVYTNQYYDFIYNGIYNDKPSWLTADEQYFLYWNTGSTELWLVSGITNGVIYNQNPEVPPVGAWGFSGNIKLKVEVFTGSCSSIDFLEFTISKTEPSCVNNGAINILANGGVPPYQYSINGGITYQSNPIFNNLGPGSYSIIVKDSINNTQNQIVNLVSNSTQTTYNLTLVKTGNNLSVNITPPLPNGVIISFDLVFNSTFSVAPSPVNATYNGNINVLVNGSPFSSGLPVITNSTAFYLPCNGSKYITNKILTWSSISLTNTSTFSGVIIDTVTPVLPSPPCFNANSTYNVNINNVKIEGCQCCNVLIIQPPTTSEVIRRL